MIVVFWLINVASALASRALDAFGTASDDNSITFDVFDR